MYSRDKREKSKKAVSVMIGYVLLVTFAVVLGGIIYVWMKTYVPIEEVNCPAGTSLFITDEIYDCNTNTLTLKMLNNGRFDLGGYFIRVTDSPDETIAALDLTRNNTDINSIIPKSLGVKFGGFTAGVPNKLQPGDSETEVYDLTGIASIYSIQIVPLRWQKEGRKMVLASCQDAVIKEDVSCFGVCTPESAQDTCEDVDCGNWLNNCFEDVDCGDCTGTDLCNSAGKCVPPAQCTDTCITLVHDCGSVCGVDCGSYGGGCQSSEYVCQNGVCICPPETDSEFCTRLNIQCDSFTANDNCGNSRTVSCGLGCPSGWTCQAWQCVDSGGAPDCDSACSGFTSSACYGNNGQCNNRGGTPRSSGDQECRDNGAVDPVRCCCLP
jgi:hypothetical protein